MKPSKTSSHVKKVRAYHLELNARNQKPRTFVTHKAFCLLLATTLSACSIFSDDSAPKYSGLAGQDGTASEGAAVPIEPAHTTTPSDQARAKQSGSQFIEVLWEIPSEAVLGYTIRFGTDEHSPSEVMRVEADKLQRVHSQDGELYRYLIPNPPTRQTVYVTIAAFDASGESAPTKAFAVPPEEKEANRTPIP